VSEGPLFGADDGFEPVESAAESTSRKKGGKHDGAPTDLGRLTESARKLNSEPDLQRLLDAVLDHVVELARAERAFLILRKGERKISVAASRSLDREGIQRASAKISRSIITQTEKSGSPVLTTNASQDPRFEGSDSVAYMKLRAVLCIPLAARGRSLGVLYLDNRFEEGVFKEVDLELVEAFAAQAAIAIENATYRQKAQAHARALEKEIAERRLAEKRLATQNAVARLLGEATDPAAVVPALVRTIGEGIGWEAGGAWEADEATGALRCTDAWHADDPALEAFAKGLRGREFPRGEGMPGRVWASRAPERCADVAQDPRHPTEGAAAAGLHAAVAFPVIVDGDVRGVLAFLSRQDLPEDRALLGMMAGIGSQVGQFVERKKSEAARTQLETILRQSQKMEAIGRLAGGVAHDFNNLITVILGFGQLAMESTGPNDPIREHLGEMEQAARRASALTRQLLAFSRKQVLDVRVLDVDQVARDMEKMLQRLLGADVRLEFVPGGGPVHVRADHGQVEQVLMNLVVNARDAMPGGGRILVETSRTELDATYLGKRAPECKPGPYAVLSVTDSGTGIPPEVLAHIFEPFFTTKEAGKGTGLGLATVYGIVRQSGGHVSVYSEPGHGATFKVFLPLVDPGEESPGDAAADRSPAPLRGTETVLVAEDDAQLRALSVRLLEDLGYRVLAAADGEAALEIAAKQDGPVDLLVTDVVMPRVGGIELARRLRELRPGIRVLYTSGYSGKSLEGRGVPDLPDVFLAKPFTETAFARRVRAILDAPAAAVPPSGPAA
jgi:two-component system cell cycle sensor histidine kinase/response regulator CckA